MKKAHMEFSVMVEQLHQAGQPLVDEATAGEKFTLLKNIPAQALSQTEMAQVEGKGFVLTNLGVLYLNNTIDNYLYNQWWQRVGTCSSWYGCYSTTYGTYGRTISIYRYY